MTKAVTTWLLDEDFCEKYLKEAVTNKMRGGLGAVSSGYGTTAINGFGSQIVGGDPAVLLRVGATSGGIASGSLSSLYAIAAGGLRRDRQK